MAKSIERPSMQRSTKGGLMIMPVGRELPPFPARTGPELTRWLDDVVDGVNRLMVESGNKLDTAADSLFKGPYLNSVRLALDPDAPLPPGVPELLARGGKSLTLSSYEVRRFAKIGALNHHVREGAWRHLPFHLKLDLVRLVQGIDEPESFLLFAEGVAHANKANVGPDGLHRFVNERVPEGVDTAGRPRGLTPKGAFSITARVAEFEDDASIQRFIDRVANMEDDADRDRLVRELESASKNFAKVVSAVRRIAKRRK